MNNLGKYNTGVLTFFGRDFDENLGMSTYFSRAGTWGQLLPRPEVHGLVRELEEVPLDEH